MSNKAGFYHKDGNRVLRILDDYQAGNEDLDTVIKQTSSTFHEEYEHRTVVNQEPITLTIGSEQTWAITSVDSSQDVQVLNRQIPINVNDSEKLTKEVNQKTISRYGKGEEQFPESDAVEVCREIWRILRADGLINVRIPFWDRIDWIDTSNRRNPSIFMDMLVAHTSMMRFQREKDDDGFYLATEEDFQSAKALFTDKDAEELVKRLTRREREFAEQLLKAPAGLTRGQMAEALGVSVVRISQLANGEAGKGGLAQKLPGFEIDEIIDTARLDDDGKSRSIKRTIYTLKGYNQFEGFDGVVKLLGKPLPTDGNLPDKDGEREGVRKTKKEEIGKRRENERERYTESKDNKAKERHENKISRSKSEENNSSLSHPQEKPYLDGKTIAGEPKNDLHPDLSDLSETYQEASDSEKETLSPEKQSTFTRVLARLQKGTKPVTPVMVRIAMSDAGYDLSAKDIKELMGGD
jgi:transcriptional regulator with XRE-family HTH domain